MAVLLCRSDGKPFPAPPPLEMRGLPRIIVDYEPLPDHSSYRGKQIATRTESHYACLDQSREEVFKDTYGRRHEQLTEGGFHTPNCKPYRELGDVQLDDSKLILGALGQVRHADDERLSHRSKSKKARIKSEPQPASLISPYRVKLHSKTPSQFPTQLLTLDHKVSEGQTQLEQIKKGNRLFGLIEEGKQKKRLEEEAKQHHDQDARNKHWKEAEVATDVKIRMENGLLLSPDYEKMRERKRGSISATSAFRRFSVVDPPCGLSTADLDISSAGSERRGSISRGGGGVSRGTEARGGDSREDERGESDPSRGESAAINPVYLWYRKLCVLVWILEAMQLDNPVHSLPLAKCWNLNRRYPDEHTAKKRYERERGGLEDYRRELYTPLRRGVFKAKVSSYLGFRRAMSLSSSKKSMSSNSKDNSLEHYAISTQKSHSFNLQEEERMKKQKKLSPTQMENLLTMLDEELNYSLKQSRSRINALIRETGNDKKKKSTLKKWSFQAPPVTLDLDDLKMQFSDADEERRMVIHEQLTAMERDREEALRQRLGALHVSGNLWQDLTAMRKGVKIESTEMARRKLLMNYHWYEELLLSLPREVKADRYCHQLLEALSVLADDMYAAGPMKMSKKKLIQVLATMKPFELQAPDIGAAVKYMMQHVVYIAEEDYEKWLQQHFAVHRFNNKFTSSK